MGYTPQQWSDLDPSFPASAARFAFMEGGIKGNSDRLDAVEANKLDQAAGKSLYEPIRRNLVVLFGTSLEAQNGTGTDTVDPAASSGAVSGRGWYHWANAYLDHRFQLVRNAGIGGNTYAQMRARLAADVLAYDSDWVLMGGPVNDISTDRTTAAIIADAEAMLDALAAAGRQVVLLNAAPSTNYNTAARRAVLAEVNQWIRQLPTTRRRVIVVDAWKVLADPVTGSPATNMAIDGIHYSDSGAMRLGREAATVLDPLVPKRPPRLSSAVDSKAIIANPHLAGGTGWSTVDTGVTAAYSPADDGWATKAVLTLSGITNGSERGIQYVEPIANARFAPGDVVQLSARIKWSSLVPVGVAALCAPFLRINPRNADSTFGLSALWATTASGEQTVPTGIPASGELVAVTHKITLGANVANLYVMAGWRGAASGTVEISDIAAVKF